MTDYCATTWPLEDPNEEDRREGNTHTCRLERDHTSSPHVCGCGAVMTEGWVLICWGDALGGHEELAGHYFVAVTDLDDGRAEYDWTPDIEHAAKFASFESAMRAWTRVHSSVPTRPDGHPNKPLTAFNVEPKRVLP